MSLELNRNPSSKNRTSLLKLLGAAGVLVVFGFIGWLKVALDSIPQVDETSAHVSAPNLYSAVFTDSVATVEDDRSLASTEVSEAVAQKFPPASSSAASAASSNAAIGILRDWSAIKAKPFQSPSETDLMQRAQNSAQVRLKVADTLKALLSENSANQASPEGEWSVEEEYSLRATEFIGSTLEKAFDPLVRTEALSLIRSLSGTSESQTGAARDLTLETQADLIFRYISTADDPSRARSEILALESGSKSVADNKNPTDLQNILENVDDLIERNRQLSNN